MTTGFPSRRTAPPGGGPDVEGALHAMAAEELRSFVRDLLAELDDGPRGVLLDALIARAAKGRSGWKPSGPSSRLVAEVERFARAARRIGQADPADVEAYLRRGARALLAGEHAAARAVFEMLLLPVAEAEIDLGQDELVDEVLALDVQECAAQYVASVYLTTPVEDCAKAVGRALDAVQGVAAFDHPLEAMERAATRPLPRLDAFLPRWVKHLEREPRSRDAWDEDRDRWLREAALRLEGVTGLERIARKTKQPEALRAWCETLVTRRKWAEALRACDVATRLAGNADWRGGFLDSAALAARQLGRPDAAERVEAAWLGAPSLVRLLRWLDAGVPTGRRLVRRARDATARCPAKAGRQLGLLHILTGDLPAAAKLLAKARGLGWSSEDHPGHVLFPAFAGLLAEGVGTTIRAELLAGLRKSPPDPWDAQWDDGDQEEPRLAAPAPAEIIGRVGRAMRAGVKRREAILEAMRVAATKRVEGLLGHQRRRHYRHAALLVACCLELAPAVGKQAAVAEWVRGLRKTYSRFPAFQEECRRALASVGR